MKALIEFVELIVFIGFKASKASLSRSVVESIASLRHRVIGAKRSLLRLSGSELIGLSSS